MKQIVEVTQVTNNKTGEVYHQATVLMPVVKFGQVRKGLVTVSLTEDQFRQLVGMEGEDFPLEIVFPDPQYQCVALD